MVDAPFPATNSPEADHRVDPTDLAPELDVPAVVLAAAVPVISSNTGRPAVGAASNSRRAT